MEPNVKPQLENVSNFVNNIEVPTAPVVENIDETAPAYTPVDTSTAVQTDVTIDPTPSEKDTTGTEPTSTNTNGEDEFSKAFSEIEKLFSPVQKQDDPEVITEPQKEQNSQEDVLYKERLDKMTERAIIAEGALAEEKIARGYAEKQLEKTNTQLWTGMEKLKELELEQKNVSAKQIHADISSLDQSYKTWKELNTEAYKYRTIMEALKIVENLSGVASETYLQTILKANTTVLPDVTSQTKTEVPQGIQGMNKPIF